MVCSSRPLKTYSDIWTFFTYSSVLLKACQKNVVSFHFITKAYDGDGWPGLGLTNEIHNNTTHILSQGQHQEPVIHWFTVYLLDPDYDKNSDVYERIDIKLGNNKNPHSRLDGGVAGGPAKAVFQVCATELLMFCFNSLPITSLSSSN